MVQLVEGLDLERILESTSKSCPEFGAYISSKDAYSERTLHVIPDTNLHGTDFMESLRYHAREHNKTRSTNEGSLPKIDVRTIEIVSEELKHDGLKRYGGAIPSELLRGEESLYKLLGAIPEWVTKDITRFYDIATESFTGLVTDLFEFGASSEARPAGSVAQDFMLSRDMRLKNGIQQNYHAMFTKLLKKKQEGNTFNYIADKILGLTNFGANFFLPNDRSILLTADNDLGAIEHFIYNTVFPRYVARNAREIVEETFPGRWEALGITSSGLTKLEDWAIKQIQAGLEMDPKMESQITNLIMNCRSGDVVVNYVHPQIRNFIADRRVGLAKSFVAETSIWRKTTPKKVIQSLEKDSKKYVDWLTQMKVQGHQQVFDL